LAVRDKQQPGRPAGIDRPQSSTSGASTRGILTGVVGTVAHLLQVPAEYEVAIEVALGGHLQDIVVESWPDAEKAIDFLREGGEGELPSCRWIRCARRHG